MTKICKICNSEFDTNNSFQKCCSKECGNINRRKLQKEWMKKHRDLEKNREYSKKYYHKTHDVKKRICKQCKKEIDSYYATFCLDCLLKNYKSNPRGKNSGRLYSRGFVKETILEAMKERGI